MLRRELRDAEPEPVRHEAPSFQDFVGKAARAFADSANNVAGAARIALREEPLNRDEVVSTDETVKTEKTVNTDEDPEKADLLARFAALERKLARDRDRDR